MQNKGEVNEKQAAFLIEEIDEKIATLKTATIHVEHASIPESIRKCIELRDIFGKQFVEELAYAYSGDEVVYS